MASPTPSIDSLHRANSIGSFGEHGEYLSFPPSADSPLSITGSSPPVSDSIDRDNDPSEFHCQQCRDPVGEPKIISCGHTFCSNCLDKNQLICPCCNTETIEGILNNLLFSPETTSEAFHSPVRCTGCKTKKLDAVARCVDCANYLCSNCVMAHQFMHCFEGHRVVNLADVREEPKNTLISNTTIINGEKSMMCPRHKGETLKFFCRTCSVPICKECINMEHPVGIHDYEHIGDAANKQLEIIQHAMQEAKAKAADVKNVVKNIEHVSARLQVQFQKAQNEVNDTFMFYKSMLEERKQEILKELESVYSTKTLALDVAGQKGQDTVDQIFKTCDFVDRLNKCATIVEILMFKKLLDTKLQGLMNFNIDQNVLLAAELEFVSNYQAIQVGVRNTFGYVRSNSEVPGPIRQPPIARPTGGSSSSGSSVNGSSGSLNGGMHSQFSLGGSSQSTSPFDSNIISKRFSSANSLGPFSTTIGDLGINGINPYEKWSNGGGDSIFQTNNADPYSLTSSSHPDSMLELTSKLMSTAIFPPKSQIKRQKMIYHCKFGEFGVMEGQFTEPSGVAVNAQNDIIVADTNNHRIQIFDKEGRFKFQFGECGKRDGQLLYPNRVAVVRTSGDIIVTERSPTHQIQIYNQYGQFVRKFGANILQHPRGVTVDNKGRIVVVECKVMRVIIFDQTGAVLQKFGCSKHLEFPNGVVVNDKQEIFISDNRAHCVKVFSYEGVYLRQIGGEGITNYPIGVGINSNGEILIADNHNNFNLTIFSQDGQLVSALESKVKHAQCFDVALMDDGSVVLASKDYRLYIYRYVQVPPIGL
ncbi:brain tumor protein [Harmonia axyridis]|uniref:brain tumor protein n=1 Tax=Harmonia axyridis TaxID=115357 RepID=UPI001E278E58|nr:brain tumor protein [Harmonia axyridis]XP_045480489.1 brain tumor protein [Harmonia axyridis]XP_045480490.1 brain tumor protein [Harmonia axyridis]